MQSALSVLETSLCDALVADHNLCTNKYDEFDRLAREIYIGNSVGNRTRNSVIFGG